MNMRASFCEGLVMVASRKEVHTFIPRTLHLLVDLGQSPPEGSIVVISRWSKEGLKAVRTG